MCKRLKEVKESLDSRMLQKTNKQMILYIIVSSIIFIIGFLFILLSLDGDSIIVCILGVIYYIFICIVESYLLYYQFLASLREDEKKKEKMFENGRLLNVVPLTLNVYMEIVNVLENSVCEQLCFSQTTFTDLDEYRNIINKMIENNEIILIAKLVNSETCISIYYKGKNYDVEELKSTNLRWFKANFSIVK